MKIMLLMWHEQYSKILLDEIQKAGHEVIYWVAEHNVSHLTPKGAIFHDHYDAWDGKGAARFEDERIPPASADLIASFSYIEPLLLTMMNKRYDTTTVDERRHIYFSMLAYWTFVFDSLEIDCVAFTSIPHNVYSNIIYEICLKRGIPSLCFEEPWVAFRILPYVESFWHGNSDLRAALKRLEGKKITVDDLGEELQEYWRMQQRALMPPPYLAMQTPRAGWRLLVSRIRIAIRSLQKGTVFSLAVWYLRRFFGKNLKDEYASIVQPVDWDIPFVYFPLHFQPERTTCPQGGVYADQILVVETLAAALPEGWQVYVKEHPSQWWLRYKEQYNSARYRGYYERLARIPNVRVVPLSTNSFDLIERSKAVAVITGTSGWESAMRGKPPLVFGLPWWGECPGILRVASVEDCRNAFAQIERGARVEQDDFIRYLKAFEESTIRAYFDNLHDKQPRSTPEENARTIAKYVTRWIARKGASGRI